MPRDATTTRELLLRAGERRFALDGVNGARTRDIVRDAGQANDSAVGYHFGSRGGLLQAIVAKHLAAMEAQRELPDPEPSLPGLVSEIVGPTAELLTTEDGRDFLRIMEQLSDWSGLAAGEPAEALNGTRLKAQLLALLALLTDRMGVDLGRERASLLVAFLTAALAARARSTGSRDGARLPHGVWVEQLVDSLTAALIA